MTYTQWTLWVLASGASLFGVLLALSMYFNARRLPKRFVVKRSIRWWLRVVIPAYLVGCVLIRLWAGGEPQLSVDELSQQLAEELLVGRRTRFEDMVIGAVMRATELAKEGDKKAEQALKEARESGDLHQLSSLLEGQRDNAERRLDESGDLYASVSLEIAALRVIEGDPQGAIQTLDQVVKRVPWSAQATLSLGTLYVDVGNLEDGAKALHWAARLAKAKEERDTYIEALQALAVVRLELGALDEAERLARLVAQEASGPSYRVHLAAAQNVLALIAYGRGELERALAIAEADVDFQPNSSYRARAILLDRAFIRTVIFTDLDEVARAEAELNKVDALVDEKDRLILDQGRFQLLRGTIAAKKETYEAALSHLSEALRDFTQADSKGDLAVTSCEIARVLIRMGKYTEARNHLEYSISYFEDQGVALRLAETRDVLSEVELRTGNDSNAAQFAESAASLFDSLGASRNAATAYGKLAISKFRLGRALDAKIAFQKAVDRGLAWADWLNSWPELKEISQ